MASGCQNAEGAGVAAVGDAATSLLRSLDPLGNYEVVLNASYLQAKAVQRFLFLSST